MKRSSSLMQAAVVLNSLPKKQAAQLLSRLDPGDMKAALDAITSLDDVSAEQISDCLKRLSDSAERWRLVDETEPSTEFSEAKEQLDAALSVLPTQKGLKVQSDQPFAFLTETIPVIRDHVLGDEHPKNIAIVLSCMPPETASECMKGLEANLRASVIKRLCELEEIHEEEVSELSYALRMRLNKLLSSRAAQTIGVQSAAELLSCSDPWLRESLLTYVSQSDPDLAFKLQRSVFGIERLLGFGDEEIKTLLKSVDTSNWAPALKNAQPELIDKVTENMGEEPRELLVNEIDQIGLVDREVEGVARKNIVQVILQLARDGKIELRKKGPRPVPTIMTYDDPNVSSTAFEIVPK